MPQIGFVTWAIDEEELRPSRLTYEETSRATREFAETSGGEHFLTTKGFPDVATAIQQILLRAEVSTPMKNLRKVLKIVLGTDDPPKIGLSEFILVVGYLKSLTKTKLIDSSSSSGSSSDEDDEEMGNNNNDAVAPAKNIDQFAVATLMEQKSLNLKNLNNTSNNNNFRPTANSGSFLLKKQQTSGNFGTIQQQQQQPNAIDLLNKGITIADVKQGKTNISASTLVISSSSTKNNTQNNNNNNNNTLISIVTTSPNANTFPASTTPPSGGITPTKNNNTNNNNNNPNAFTLHAETSLSSTPSNQLNVSNQFSGLNRSLSANGDDDTHSYFDAGLTGSTYQQQQPPPPQHKPKFVTRKRVELFESSMMMNNGSSSDNNIINNINNPNSSTNVFMMSGTFNNAAASSADRQEQLQLQQAGLSRANRPRQQKFMFSESVVGNIQNIHGVGYVDRYKLREGDFQSSVTKRKLKDVLRRHTRSVERVKRDQYHMAVHGMGGTLMDERKPFKAVNTVFATYRFEPPISHEMTGLPLFVSGKPVPKKIRDIEEQRRIAAVRRGEIEGAGRSKLRCRTCTPDHRPSRFDVAAGRVSPRQLNLAQLERAESKQRQIRRLSLMMSPAEVEMPMTPSDEPSGVFCEEFSGDFGSLTPPPIPTKLQPLHHHQHLQHPHLLTAAAATPQPTFVSSTPSPSSQQQQQQQRNNNHNQHQHGLPHEKLPPVMSKSLKADAANRVYGTAW